MDNSASFSGAHSLGRIPCLALLHVRFDTHRRRGACYTTCPSGTSMVSVGPGHSFRRDRICLCREGPLLTQRIPLASMARLILPSELRAQITEWCLSHYPNEACGLIAGRRGELCVERVYPIANIEVEKPSSRYFMDPRGQWKAMRDAETSGLEVIGAFHSHVRSEPYPSATDVELAMYPEWIWVIVSLRCRDEPELRAYTIRDSAADEVEISVGK
ncbi:MAG: hypothetical protein C4318_08485 [Acidimicrobiia bacterium]